MNTNRQTDNRESDWQTLGELELPDYIDPNDAIRTWLSQVLNNLSLSREFYERFLKAAQASARRAQEVNGPMPPAHVLITILASRKDNSIGKSWGFFQIEKIEIKANNGDSSEHAIDFYLYVEGD